MTEAAQGRDTAASESTAQIRGSSGLALGRVIALLLGLAVQVIIVRTLTKAGYGAFAYALSLVPALRLVVSFGTARATSRFLALYREQNDSARLAGLLVLQTLGFVLLGGLVWAKGDLEQAEQLCDWARRRSADSG